MDSPEHQRDDVAQITEVLMRAAAIVPQRKVALMYDTDELETVFVDTVDEGLLVSDHGATFAYLFDSLDSTFEAWSAVDAERICHDCGVDLVGGGDDHEGYAWQIERLVRGGDSLPAAVGAVSRAIDQIFDDRNRYSSTSA